MLENGVDFGVLWGANGLTENDDFALPTELHHQ
jgi:hypothetical protein